jgi:hypothetical protein
MFIINPHTPYLKHKVCFNEEKYGR